MLEDRRIFKAISRFKLRSEGFEDGTDSDKTFVDAGIIDELENENHHILYGRRGTGKTHVLKVLQQRWQHGKGTAAIYLDCRTLGSTELLTHAGISPPLACLNLCRDILTRIHSLLLDYVIEKAGDQADYSLKALDELLAATSEPVEQFLLQKLAEEEQHGQSGKVDATAKLNLSGSPGLNLSASAKTDNKIAVKTSYDIKIDDSISFVRADPRSS
jgi:hypothetical protein